MTGIVNICINSGISRRKKVRKKEKQNAELRETSIRSLPDGWDVNESEIKKIRNI